MSMYMVIELLGKLQDLETELERRSNIAWVRHDRLQDLAEVRKTERLWGLVAQAERIACALDAELSHTRTAFKHVEAVEILIHENRPSQRREDEALTAILNKNR